MSDMNERIRSLRQEESDLRSHKSSEQSERIANFRRKGEQYLQIGAGLRTLIKLLVSSGVHPEGSAVYSSSTTGATSLHDGRLASDGRAQLDKVRSWQFWRNADSYWYLGAWTDSYPGTGGHEVTSQAHNYVSAGGRVISGRLSYDAYDFVDLDRLLAGPAETAYRLEIVLGGMHNPSGLVEAIIWTAAHYGLDWPASAPDLSKFLG